MDPAYVDDSEVPLHVLALEASMVVVTEQLDDGEGHRLNDAQIDLAIIRRGFESDHQAHGAAKRVDKIRNSLKMAETEGFEPSIPF